MPQVSLTLNGRIYRFVCEAGEEDHFLTLAHYLQAKVESVRSQFGKVGDERILAMAALLVTDELFEARAMKPVVEAAAQQRMAAPRAPRASKAAAKAGVELPAASPMDQSTDRANPAPDSAADPAALDQPSVTDAT